MYLFKKTTFYIVRLDHTQVTKISSKGYTKQFTIKKIITYKLQTCCTDIV